MSRRPFRLLLPAAIFVVNLAGLGAGGSSQSSQSTARAAVQPGVVQFEDIAQHAGITMKNFYGSDTHKEFIIETTGNGSIIFDYDNDGWPDIFLPNGSTVARFSERQGADRASLSQQPRRNLYRRH